MTVKENLRKMGESLAKVAYEKGYTAGHKEGEVVGRKNLAEEINDICKDTDIGGVCIMINKKAFLDLIDIELRKEYNTLKSEDLSDERSE